MTAAAGWTSEATWQHGSLSLRSIHPDLREMHPALIPELHPLCGKYMEALKQCRKEHPFRKYVGVCSEITWDLSLCLKEEKKIVREPRQQRYQERWSQKRQADMDRMEQLRQQRTNLSDAPGTDGAAAPPGASAASAYEPRSHVFAAAAAAAAVAAATLCGGSGAVAAVVPSSSCGGSGQRSSSLSAGPSTAAYGHTAVYAPAEASPGELPIERGGTGLAAQGGGLGASKLACNRLYNDGCDDGGRTACYHGQ